MPLNQSQRNEIEESIAHLFYGASVDELPELRRALENPLSSKEHKEQAAQHQGVFAPLTQLISNSESLLKGLETRNVVTAIRVNDVSEYIIFYSICCAQYHLESPDADDDFNINAWLQSKGLTPKELEEDWKIQTFLAKTAAHAFFNPLDWNVKATFNRLKLLPVKIFETHNPPVDYGSYNFNWDLPKLDDRMYHAQIQERWNQARNLAGKVISVIPVIDLYVEAHLSRYKKAEITLKAFKPYPIAPPLSKETLQEIDEHINGQVFETSEKQALAKKNAIARAENFQVMQIEAKIKAEAQVIAEKEAIKLIVNYLESQSHEIASASVAQLRPQNDNEHDLSDMDDHSTGLHDPHPSHTPALPIPAALHLDIDNSDDDVVEFDANNPVRPPLNSLSSPSRAMSTPRLMREIDALLADINELLNSPSLSRSPQRAENSLPPPPILMPARSPNSPPLISIQPPNLNNAAAPQLPTQPPIIAPATQPAAINLNAPGFLLVMYTYYYNEIKTDRMRLSELEALTADEVRNLQSPAVILLLNAGLSRSVALQFSAGTLRLLETSYYVRYFQQHLEKLTAVKNIALDHAVFMTFPFVSNLLERGDFGLEYFLAFTPEEAAVMKNNFYGHFFYLNPQMIRQIKGITAFERDILFNETVRDQVEKKQLSIDAFRVLAKNLQPFQLDILLDPACQELFSKSKLLATTLDQITPTQAANLREKGLITLMEQDILPVEIGKNLSIQEKIYFLAPLTYKLLLDKKIIARQVKHFTPMIATILETKPYKTLLEKKPEYIGLLQNWTEDELNRLLAPTILRLFTHGKLNLPHLNNPCKNFFPILNGDRICELLIQNKILLSQALKLTSLTWVEIEHRQYAYDLLRNNDNNRQPDYIPYKIWSSALKNRLIAIYRNNPEVYDNMSDTAEIINSQIDLIAEHEHLSKQTFRNRVIELFLKFLRDDIHEQLSPVSQNSIPHVYNTIIHEIQQAVRSPHPLWLQTLAKVARHAKAELDLTHRFQPIVRRPSHTLRQNFFNQPVQITHQGIRDFCQNLLKVTPLNPDINRVSHARRLHHHQD